MDNMIQSFTEKLMKALLTAIIACLVVFGFLAMITPADASEPKYNVTNDDIVNALENYLASQDIYSDISYRIYTKRIIDTVTSNSEIEIRIMDKARTKLLKSDNFQVVLFSNGKTIRQFELRGYIGIEVPVAVASKDLLKGERLDNNAAYSIAFRDLTGCAVRMPVYENDNIASLVMRVNCQAGRELDKSLMEQPDVVQRGERVIVFYEHDTLVLTMIGKALEPGKIGQFIKILNETSKKTVVGEVTAEGEVVVR